jgi:hypothetical protein
MFKSLASGQWWRKWRYPTAYNKVVSAEVKILNGKNHRLHIDVLRLDNKHVVHTTDVFMHNWNGVYTRKLVFFDRCN